jgi:hypothetical protein
MNPVFQTIRFGSFSTEYHRSAVDTEFKESLSRFLASEVLPQVDEPFDTTDGELTTEYDEERYCGPNSAVRDAYRLRFRFIRSDGADELDAHIYRDKSGDFRARYKGAPLRLRTKLSEQVQREINKQVQEIVGRIRAGEAGAWSCPHCGSELALIDSPAIFDLTCPKKRCFTVNYHRDPETGEFMHGHYFSRPNVRIQDAQPQR